MMDSPPLSHNQPTYSVSEISGAVKNVIEQQFDHVRVRGEISKVVRQSSGHSYFDLKDDKAVLAAVCWKGTASRFNALLQMGLEVYATGRISTYGGQSKYQLIVEHLEPAGAGALLALLEQRKEALRREGLFDEARKQPLPFLPKVIGVVTSPTGAVIRDILHRVADRFPCHVLLWPVRVQGEGAALEIATAIAGFNQLKAGGVIPRPDLLIVGRGGGSTEDLWCFNEEIVVRAAAASDIPLISAVGHETDTTLIDYVADRRAPTPTAAAEMALPVRTELQFYLQESNLRMARATQHGLVSRRERLVGLSRGLPRPEDFLAQAQQRLDSFSERLSHAPRQFLQHKQVQLSRFHSSLAPERLRQRLRDSELNLQISTRLLMVNGRACLMRAGDGFQLVAMRLATPLLHQQIARRTERVAALARMLETLDYREVLRRGYVLVRDAGGQTVSSCALLPNDSVTLQFHDGEAQVRRWEAGQTYSAHHATPTKRQKKATMAKPPNQGSLF
ncbi:MAG: exodeoxyribonuclease VII large subunit [Rickettsiales bacterium]|nr:exodeoxyribonuclease VII large subunit [Rickettsiales bacterium]